MVGVVAVVNVERYNRIALSVLLWVEGQLKFSAHDRHAKTLKRTDAKWRRHDAKAWPR